MHIYNEWLPPPVAKRAAEAEPRRFHALVLALVEAQKQGDVKATLKFVSPIVSFLNSLTELDIRDVEGAANAALHLATSCPENLFAQVRGFWRLRVPCTCIRCCVKSGRFPWA